MKLAADKSVDRIQLRLTEYAWKLRYEDLPAEVVHAAKVRIIDTLGALIGGFFAEPCFIARNLARSVSDAHGATVIGTRIKTALDIAAFVNASTARNVELTDAYHSPGSQPGHPSDAVAPILVAAEHAQATGRDFLAGVVLAYEVYLRLCDVIQNRNFDNTHFACLGTALAAAKVFGLSPAGLSHCIAMAAAANVTLRQVREGHLSMFKSVAAGQAGRAGIFAAQLAQAGMEGPHLPFEGKAGWCDHVGQKRFSLETMGGNGTPFKILDTRIKIRPSMAETISSILAAEKIAPLKSIKDVKQVTLETYKKGKANTGTDECHWNPESRETADHSAPYVVAATLMDGTITPRSFDDAHLWNAELRALMQKIEVVENEAFTRANEQVPVEHHARVTVVMTSGERLVGKTGGDADDLSAQRSDAQIEQKFRGLAEAALGTQRTNSILDQLWQMENLENMAVIPPLFSLE